MARLSQDIVNATVRVAIEEGMEPAGLLAIIEVETAGEPFERDGATPRFLFERHKFHDWLIRNSPELVEDAENLGLAHAGWRKATQYKDQGSSVERAALAARVKAIDEEGFYQSCSWGLGQILGSHCQDLSFATAESMVSYMAESIENQIKLIAKFIKHKRLDRPLQQRNWDAFAAGYNGKRYRENNYHTKLAAAFKRWSKPKAFDPDGIPEENPAVVVTPRPDVIEAVTQPFVKEPGLLQRGDKGPDVKRMQAELKRLNYSVGRVDGDYGRETFLAVVAFQADNLLSDSPGIWRDSYFATAKTATPRFISRQNATAEDLEAMGSKPARRVSLWTRISGWLGLGSLLTAITDKAMGLPDLYGFLNQTVPPISGAIDTITSNKLFLFAFVLLALALLGRLFVSWLVDMFRAGQYDADGTDAQPAGEVNAQPTR